MEILIGLTVLTAGGLIWFTRVNDDSFLAIMSATMGGICLLSALTILIIAPLSVHAGIERVEATRETYQAARAAGLTLENAAIQTDVAEVNRWLASQRYWNRTLFDLWIPDEVENVRPIR